MTYEDGFDCSGFISSVVSYATEAYDLDLAIPRHANEQWRNFGEYVDYSQRQVGDLVFFARRRHGDDRVRTIGHVGIVVARNKYVHAEGCDDSFVAIGGLPNEQRPLAPILPNDLYTNDPAGVKRITAPVHSGRWEVW